MSQIPTRRSTRSTLRPASAVGDENANPPALRKPVAGRSAKVGGTTAATSASLAKQAPARADAGDKVKARAVDPDAKKVGTAGVPALRKRAALGEVLGNKSNAPGASAPAGSKAEDKEKKPAARPVIVRRTTRLSAQEAEQKVAEQAAVRPQPRRRNTTVLDEQAGASTSNFQAASRSALTTTASVKSVTLQPTRPHKRNLQPSASHELDERYQVHEPTQKRIRTSDAVEPAHEEVRANVREASTSTVAAVELEEIEVDWDDLDAEDALDPQMVSEYVHDILKYMKELEIKTMPNPDYMDSQPTMEWKMRGILMDWLVEVHHKFRLLPETLFLATNIIDRFLSSRVVSLPKFQLVGITCLFIAAKYEEVVCPSVNNFLFMAEGGYKIEEILQAERYVLATLDFDLSYPNPIHFLRRISKADAYDIHTRTIAKCLMELSCVDHTFIEIPPSLLAAASMWLARFVLDRDEWDANLTHYSGYTEAEIIPAAQLMVDYFYTDPDVKHEAFERKWSGRKYMKAIVLLRDFVGNRWEDHPRMMDFKTGRAKILDWELDQRGPLQMDLERQERKRDKAREAK